jgi:sterol desaturase/sphingolipid hydroxylase (fatty acid hydroxylase superfamily)
VILTATALLAAWGGLLFVVERLWPASPRSTDSRRLFRNLALGVLLLLVSPLVQWATLQIMTDAQPLLKLDSLIAALLVLDLWTYALHRAYHRIPFMWRLHAPHHFDAHLDVTSAVRFHIGEILWSSILRLIPLVAFGIPLEVNALFGVILTASALFHHSNLRLPPTLERPLSWLIVTPSIHWVHHHAVQRDTDANYASILSIWDRLFGSRSTTERWPEMPIGVEGAGEKRIGRLLLWPIIARRERTLAD